MVFKRREKRSTGRLIREAVYPPGGWGRAVNYLYHRLRRLPDPPHRIARGIAAGVFITFSPFVGVHFFLAAFVAWAVRGNVIAGMLATLLGNPLTFPIIGASSLSMGNLVLGRPAGVRLRELSHAFADAGGEVWWNLRSIFTASEAHWGGLGQFFHDIFLPYLVGGAINGLIMAFAVYLLAHPVIAAYQRRRSRSLQRRLHARLKAAGQTAAE